MWSVKRVTGSDSKWIVYKDNQFKGTVCILDLDFSGNIELEGEDSVEVINHIEDLITGVIAEEQLLMNN